MHNCLINYSPISVFQLGHWHNYTLMLFHFSGAIFVRDIKDFEYLLEIKPFSLLLPSNQKSSVDDHYEEDIIE